MQNRAIEYRYSVKCRYSMKWTGGGPSRTIENYCFSINTWFEPGTDEFNHALHTNASWRLKLRLGDTLAITSWEAVGPKAEVEELRKKITEVGTERTNLRLTVGNLTYNNDKLKAEVEELKASNNSLKKRLDELQYDYDETSDEADRLQDRLDDALSKAGNLQTRLDSEFWDYVDEKRQQEAKITELEAEVAWLVSYMRNR